MQIINSALNNRLNSQRNKTIIMSLVRMYPGIARASLARYLNLSPTAITDLVNGLIEQKLLIEEGVSISKRGRRPVKLGLAKNEHFFLTIQLGGDVIRLAVMDLNGDILAYTMEDTARETTLQKRLDLLYAGADKVVRESGRSWDEIEAIGCGIAAYVDPLKNIVPFAENIPGMVNVPLAEVLGKKYGKPCYVENAVHLLALAEKYYGSAREVENFIYLNVGQGISLGIFTAGALYFGANGAAGEIGHVRVEDDGPQCNCGKTGCLESVASSSKITEAVLTALGKGVSSRLTDQFNQAPDSITAGDISRAAEEGDLLSTNVIRKAGDYLCGALAGVIQTLNPQLVVIGGEMFSHGNLLLDHIRSNVKFDLLPYISKELSVEKTAVEYDQAFLLGALILISERHWAPELAQAENEVLGEAPAVP